MQYTEQTEHNQQIAEYIDIYSLLQWIMKDKRRRENLSKCPKLPGYPKLPRLTVPEYLEECSDVCLVATN